MKRKHHVISVLTAAALLCTSAATAGIIAPLQANATESIESAMSWDTVEISGGGFVSGIVTSGSEMYARTDVGGAYRYDFDKEEWVQLLAFLNEEDRGFLSVDAMCVDPTDDQTIYLLCGCAYFSGARTAIFRSHDGGETFDEIDVTDLIQVHGNGSGRQCGEAIAVDPDNPNIIYCGGDVADNSSGLIMSEDGGDTWKSVDGYSELDFFRYNINWPYWESHSVSCVLDDQSDTGYAKQNGVASIVIQNGKVYVASSVAESGNVAVTDVGSDDFTVLSDALPTDCYPSRINLDADGNLLISYVAGLIFEDGNGGVYRYDIDANTVTDISPVKNSIGACISLSDDPDMLIATTCGVWSTQQWEEGGETAWGEWIYRSTDGGKTWTSIYPGKRDGIWVWDEERGEMHDNVLYGFLQDGGCSWIRNKAIHWSGALVANPRNDTEFFVTSGNGVFEWDNLFPQADGTDDPIATFHADGIEEVVALDMTSVPGGAVYSAIGDYDGFKHTDTTVSGEQYQPNMGSTGAIAYCPQNPDVMIRIAESQNDISPGYYTLDGGKTWTKMANPYGGYAAITQLEDGSYRFFNSESSNNKSSAVSYSDDYGQTWSACTGIPSAYGSKPTYMFVEPDQPNIVYAYVTYYNESWFYSKSAPDFSDAHYTLCISTDYGKTFSTSTDIAMYDQCDSAGRIAYLSEGTLALAAGWYGAYVVSDYGKTVTKMENVYYCKTMGYGAAQNEGDPYTLYMYGKPEESDPEGVYRSTDGGESWLLINQDKLYGGTGNGHFLVGDMNVFGKIYMSTVGCGIVVGELTDEQPPLVTTTEKATTTKTTTTTTVTTAASTKVSSNVATTAASTAATVESTTEVVTTEKTTSSAGSTETTSSIPFLGSLCGDVNLDGAVNMSDAILLSKRAVNLVDLTAKAEANADCNASGVIDGNDALILLQFCVQQVYSLPYTQSE